MFRSHERDKNHEIWIFFVDGQMDKTNHLPVVHARWVRKTKCRISWQLRYVIT